MRKIILASRSPGRAKLLKQIGLQFEIKPSNCAEDMQAFRAPKKLAQFLALEKARCIAKKYKNAIIIGADTFIIYQGALIGKPKDKKDAKRILTNFSGNIHKIISGYALIDTKNKKEIIGYGEAKVKFRKLSQAEIKNYIAQDESLDKAGAYSVSSKASVLIEEIKGDFYSIIGLPLAKVYVDLKKLGIDALK